MAGTIIMDGPYLVKQLQSLWEQGMESSCRILADMILTNYSIFDITDQSIHLRRLLITFADSLYSDNQYHRAMHYYQNALTFHPIKTSSETQSTNDMSDAIEIKWKIYKCNMELKQYQEALDELLTIPVNDRTTKITLAMAKLYHYHKRENHTAMVYYRMVLMQSPFAIEAVIALLSLGISWTQLEMLLKQHPQSMLSMPWFRVWLSARENIATYQYADAVNEFENLTKMGLTLSPEMNAQIGWCMSKLSRKSTAIELFKTSRAQDPYILSHMDTYARLLTVKTGVPNDTQLADHLLTVSTMHIEPWLVKLWSVVRKSTWKGRSIDVPNVNVLVSKICSISDKLGPVNSEAKFLLGAICVAKQGYEDAITHYHGAVKSDPSFFEAYENMLRCYMICRGYKAAFSAMKNAIRYIKIPAQQLFLEAIVLANKPQFRAKAKVCLQNAIKADRTFEKAPLSLCVLYRQEKKPEKAVDIIVKTASHGEHFPISLVNVWLTQILQHHQSAALHAEMGKCMVLLKRHTEAIIQYELALRIDPDHKETIQAMQELETFMQRGEEEEEEDNYEEAEENKMDDVEDVLVWGSEEHLEGVREFGHDIIPMMDFDDDAY